MFTEIKEPLRQSYRDEKRRWLVGFSGGKDPAVVASLLNRTGRNISEFQTVARLREAQLPKLLSGGLRVST